MIFFATFTFLTRKVGFAKNQNFKFHKNSQKSIWAYYTQSRLTFQKCKNELFKINFRKIEQTLLEHTPL